MCVCLYVATTTFTSWLVVAAWSTGLCCSNLEGKCSLGGPAGRPVIGPNSDHHTLPTLPLMNVSECLLVVGRWGQWPQITDDFVMNTFDRKEKSEGNSQNQEVESRMSVSLECRVVTQVVSPLCRRLSSPSRQSLFRGWFTSTCTAQTAPWTATPSTRCPTSISVTSRPAARPPPLSSPESPCAG